MAGSALKRWSTVVEKPFKVGFPSVLNQPQKESIPMKSLFIFAGIFAAIVLAEGALRKPEPDYLRFPRSRNPTTPESAECHALLVYRSWR